MSHLKHVDDNVAFRDVITVCTLLSSLPWGLGDCYISLFSDWTVLSFSFLIFILSFHLSATCRSQFHWNLSESSYSFAPACVCIRRQLALWPASQMGPWAICSKAFQSRNFHTVFYVIFYPPPPKLLLHTCVRTY